MNFICEMFKRNLIFVCWIQVVNGHSPGTATLGMLPFGFWHYHSSCRKLAGPTLVLGSGEVCSWTLHRCNIKQRLPSVTRTVYPHWTRGDWHSRFCVFNSILSFNRQTVSSDKLTHGKEDIMQVYTRKNEHTCRRITHNMLSFQLIYW